MALSSQLVYALLPIFLSSQSVSDQIANEEREKLAECLELVETDAEAAYELGLTWLYEGNRPGARECKATAMIALGYLEDGALDLEDLANAPDAGTLENRAYYWGKAGNAWLQLGAADEALVTFDNALKLVTDDADLYKYRAQAYLALEDWDKAEADLDESLSRQPGDLNAWLYRAEARMNQNRLDEAMEDVTQARAIDPENIDALLMRGHIREAARIAEEG